MAVLAISTFVSGIIIAFTRSYLMTLVMMAFLPLLALMGYRMAGVFSSMEAGAQQEYATAGACGTEAVALIRTVAAFGGEAAEVARYDTHLAAAEAAGIKKSLSFGTTIGLFMGIMFSLYATGLYYGATLILASRAAHPECVLNPTIEVCFTGGTVMQVLFSSLVAAMSLGQAAPNMGAIAAAQGAAARVFAVIDRVPPIDADAAGGVAPLPATVRGAIEFRNVTFAYPSRPDAPVLRNFSLVIPPGA